MKETVDHPDHYNSHPSGVESADVSIHLSHALGSAWDYVYRHKHKSNPLEDLRKAMWWIQREEWELDAGLNENNHHWNDDFYAKVMLVLSTEPDPFVRECLLQIVIANARIFPLTFAIESLNRLIERTENGTSSV